MKKKSPITKRKVRDGIIVSEEVSIDLTSTKPINFDELRRYTFLQTVEDRIRALQSHASTVLKTDGTQAKYAADSISAFDDALRHLKKITGTKSKKAAKDFAWCLLNACQSLWRTDFKAVEPTVITGAGAEKQRREGGQRRGEESTAERKPEWDKWQKAAEAIYKRSPHFSKSQICKSVADKYGVSERIVSKRVRRFSR